MKYRLSVWNSIIILLIPIIAWVLIKRTAEPNTIIAAAYGIPIIIIGAIIDFVLQQVIRNNWTLAIIEIISLTAIMILNNS